MAKIIVDADTKAEALKKGSKKIFLDGKIKVPGIATNAIKHPNPRLKGKFIVTVRRDKRFL